MRLKSPQNPPDLNFSPSFRQTIRLTGISLTVGSLVYNITTFLLFQQDAKNYGLPSTTNRWQGINIIAARVFASAVTAGQPTIDVGVNSLSPNSQSVVNFTDSGNISQNAVCAFRWPKLVAQTNIFATTNTVLFGITNVGLVTVQCTVDVDAVFTG